MNIYCYEYLKFFSVFNALHHLGMLKKVSTTRYN